MPTNKIERLAPPLAVAHDAERQQRVGDPPLADHEAGEQHDRAGEQPDRERARPRVRRRLGEPVHEGHEPADGEQRTGDVEAGADGPLLIPQERDRPETRQHGEADVHVQAPPPVEVLGERAAEQEPDGAAGTGDRSVDAKGLPALGRLGEGRREERERCWGEQRPEGALGRPRGDEHREACRRPADGRCQSEADHARQEHALSAEEVGHTPAEQEEPPNDSE